MHADSYIYQYLVGSVIFFFALWLCWYHGDLRPSRHEDRRFLTYSLIGLVLYAVGQGILQFWCAAP